MAKWEPGEEYTESAEAYRQRIDVLIEQLEAVLDGHNQLVIGAVLSELTGVWVAGFRPSMQADMLKLHIEYTKKMVEEESGAIWKDDEIIVQ